MQKRNNFTKKKIFLHSSMYSLAVKKQALGIWSNSFWWGRKN